jgi:hypothetical protein
MTNALEHELFVMFAEPLSEHGFVRDGNYFRRNISSVMQAIHLQPASWGGNYYPEMMITYPKLSTQRQNTLKDAHLRANLSDFYNPHSDPPNDVFWSCHLSRIMRVPDVLKSEIVEAIEHAQAWFELYPDYEIAVERMRIWKYAKSVHYRELFNDLGMAVPTPLRALKRKLFAMFSELLGKFGFMRDGNYFRRNTSSVMQAIYLQPSKWGGEYFPEMMITYPRLSAQRRNTQNDAHLRTRLSSFYHPLGDPSANIEWSCDLSRIEDDPDTLKSEIASAIECALAWFDLYPDYEIVIERMRISKYAIPVTCYEMFNDIGMKAPMWRHDVSGESQL